MKYLILLLIAVTYIVTFSESTPQFLKDCHKGCKERFSGNERARKECKMACKLAYEQFKLEQDLHAARNNPSKLRPGSPANRLQPSYPANRLQPSYPANRLQPGSPPNRLQPGSPPNRLQPGSPSRLQPGSPSGYHPGFYPH